jgi:hopanoid biosynthesis associated RND transporter like protein HpnN
MLDALALRYRLFLSAWVDGVRRAAPWVVVLSVLSAVAAGGYVATHVRINTDTSDMLSPELEFRRNSRALSEAFPQFSDNLVVVVDGVTPDLADDAALRLAEALRGRPDLFGEVHDLAGDPFFRRNGLLYKDAGELADLGDRLAQAQPFLGALWKDPSLRGLVRMLGLAVDEAVKPDADLPLEIGGVLESIARVAEAQAAGEYLPLSWRALMEGGKADEDIRRVFVVRPALDFGSLQPASAAIEGVRAIAADLGLTPDRGVRVRLTGSAALSQEELKSVERSMGLANLLSLVVVAALLFAGFRSGRLAFAAVIALVVGLVWTAAFAQFAIGTFNLISVAFAVLFIGLSVDFGIHFGLRYREGLDAGQPHDEALRSAASGVGGALTLCAVSAAVAFYSFLPTDYRGLAELGLIAGTGMFFAFLANLTVLPAVASLLPPAPRVRGRDPETGFEDAIVRHARPVVAMAVLLALGSAALLPKAYFDFDPLNLKDPETESVATVLDLMKDERTSPRSIDILAPDRATAEALAAKLKTLPEVDGAITLADYLPKDQEEKLEILSSLGMFLLPSLSSADRRAPPDAGELKALLDDLEDQARRLAGGPDAGLRPVGKRLLDALDRLPADGAAEFQDRLLSGLPGRLRDLRTALDAGPVTLDDLPAPLRDREIAGDGRAKVTVRAREDLQDREALKRFVAAVRAVAPGATGTPVVILEAGNAVVGSFLEAGAIAVSVIGLLLAFLMRRLRDVLLVFAPLVLAGLMTAAVTVLIGTPFNFANLIVLPLLFGLGVAGSIYLVLRGRINGGAAGALATSTPRAVLYSALTTIASFGSLALSTHPGMASMGVLLTVSIACSLFSTLVFLPALAVATGKGGVP